MIGGIWSGLPTRLGILAISPISLTYKMSPWPQPFVPGPDLCGDYILNSNEDPCYELEMAWMRARLNLFTATRWPPSISELKIRRLYSMLYSS